MTAGYIKIIINIKLLILLIIVAGCGTVTPVFHKGNNAENYQKIFGEPMPANVQVVNSIYITYSGFNVGFVTTPDWEIELIADRKWIKDKAEKLNLRNVKNPQSSEFSSIKTRLKSTSKWYAPKPISNYDCYYLYPTSVPYVHMLVDKTPVRKDSYKVFLSKH